MNPLIAIKTLNLTLKAWLEKNKVIHPVEYMDKKIEQS